MELQTNTKKGNFAKASTYLSIGCAVHCMISPFFLMFLPFLNTTAHQYFWLEVVVVGLAAILGISASWHNYKAHQTSIHSFYILLGGFACMFIGLIFHESVIHIPLMLIGAGMSLYAQWIQYQQKKSFVHS